jgi:SHS2 domain-containing protein
VKNYEFIEHTADIGIRVKGDDLKGLFINAALAMFEIIAEKQKTESTRQVKAKIEQEADNLEELFINWLNELLSLSATKELIFSEFKIDKLDENSLKAIVTGNDIKNYKVNTEIKAATYHQLKIQESESGWQAEVIFDV